MIICLYRAVWWLEHTMRHPTIYQGKNPVHRLNTLQYFQLDVIAFLALVVMTLLYLLSRLVKCCCHCCCGKGPGTLTKRKSE